MWSPVFLNGRRLSSLEVDFRLCSFHIRRPIFLCCSSWCPLGLALAWWLSDLLTNWAKYPACISSSILSFKA